MKIFRTMQGVQRHLLVAAGAAAILALSGCETTDQNAEGTESNIPWNQPQPWEGAPGIPGMSQ